MCLAEGTVFLQKKRLTDVPSVAVNKFEAPALDRARSRDARDKPARGGGVNMRGSGLPG